MNRLIFSLTLFFFTTPSFADDFWQQITLPTEPLITQYDVNAEMGCVPTSLLYLFKLGPPSLNQIYKNLFGNNDYIKLLYIIATGLKLPSRYRDQMVFRADSGSTYFDTNDWLKELAQVTGSPVPPVLSTAINREKNETTPGIFLSRIHDKWSKSLDLGFPVIIDVQVRTTKFSENISNKFLGHDVLVVAIQKNLDARDLGFQIKYINPLDGLVATAFVYEEVNDPFNADIYDPLDSFKYSWSKGDYVVSNQAGKKISSPYLKLTAPSMFQAVFSWDVAVDIFVRSDVSFAQ